MVLSLPPFLSVRWLLILGAAVASLGRPTRAGEVDRAGGEGLFIQEYRVEGVRHLPRELVEEMVYPFLGPGRTEEDVERARSSLEGAYRARGYQAVSVQVPPQQVKEGVVILQVVEGVVKRLRVNGARFSAPSSMKALVPSLKEGEVVNFQGLPREILALNQSPDRRVTPVLRPGETPGTVEVDLNVVESTPLHATVELNNRRSANTSSLRLNASAVDNNFLQRGDTFGLSLQVAPERPADARVLSAYYVTRPASRDGLTLMLQGTRQDSSVSTLGGAAVIGRGMIGGARALLRLPAVRNFVQSLSLGFDYKHLEQTLQLGPGTVKSPITYWPLGVTYAATRLSGGTETNGSLGIALHLRGLGSSPAEYDNRRYGADGDFAVLRGEVSHVADAGRGWQVFLRASGQLASGPLLDSEQASGGGLGTVRGYLESEVVGDNAAFSAFELRAPALAGSLGEWRPHLFGEAGLLQMERALPQQRGYHRLASIGAGARFRLPARLSGSLDAGLPLIAQMTTRPHDLRFTFRLWADF